MAQLGLISYFREACITYSIYMKRWFKIHPLPAPFSPTLWHQPTREGREKNEWGHWVKTRQVVKVPLQHRRLPGTTLVLAQQLEMLIFWQWLPRAPEEEVSPERVHCRGFYWLNLMLWWERRRCWLAATAVEFSCPRFLLRRRCIASILSRRHLLGCGAGKEGHPRWGLALLLPVRKHDTLGYLHKWGV